MFSAINVRLFFWGWLPKNFFALDILFSARSIPTTLQPISKNGFRFPPSPHPTSAIVKFEVIGSNLLIKGLHTFL
jgi:hypothetical protein